MGGRYFDTKSDTTVTRPPSAYFPASSLRPPRSSTNCRMRPGFTPKVTLAFRPRDGLLAYATYSQGFRVGGAKIQTAHADGSSNELRQRPSKNYEIGMRADLADNRVLLDATVFRIDWTDIQVALVHAGTVLLFVRDQRRRGQDRRRGVLRGAFQPTDILGFNTSITYQDARPVSKFLPDTFAANGLGGYPPGTVLPGSSKWTTALTATLRFEQLPFAPRFEGDASLSPPVHRLLSAPHEAG